MKYVQKYILVPKEEWEKINPQVKNVKQLHIPKREKNTLHHQKVVKNFQAKNPQMKTTLMKTNGKKQYQSSSENSASGEEFGEEYKNECTEKEESYEYSETEENIKEKEDE